MTTYDVDLWPEDLQVPDEQTPAIVLRRQAQRLVERTNGRVTADVLTQPLPGGRLIHKFVLQAVSLGGYQHTLLEAVHEMHKPYPVKLSYTLIKNRKEEVLTYECHTQAEFENDLREIFGATQTRELLYTLLAA